MPFYVFSVRETDYTRVVYISHAVSDFIYPDWTVAFNGLPLTQGATPRELGMSSEFMNWLDLVRVDHPDTDTDASGDASPCTSEDEDDMSE
jgi:hypothetical protein